MLQIRNLPCRLWLESVRIRYYYHREEHDKALLKSLELRDSPPFASYSYTFSLHRLQRGMYLYRP